MDITKKKIAIFDLDGTLTESKSAMDVEMADIFNQLLTKKKVAVISGGAFGQYEKQVIAALGNHEELLKNLFLFPTSGTRFYRYENGWKEIYADMMSVEDRKKITEAFHKSFAEINYHHPETVYGEIIEDRGTQVTFSAVGQKTPLEVKKHWHANFDRREEIAAVLKKYLPEFEIRIPGMSSIDVTPKGIDKAYGISQIEKHLGISRHEMVFVGDALYEGGNDYPVKAAGVDCIAVTGPEDTKKLISGWLGEMA